MNGTSSSEIDNSTNFGRLDLRNNNFKQIQEILDQCVVNCRVYSYIVSTEILPLVPVAGASLGSKTSMSRLTCNGSFLSGFMISRARLVT